MRAVLLLGLSACAAAPCLPSGDVQAPACAVAPCTDVIVVAHEDDDLLFVDPDLRAALASGHHVVTVFVTAGELSDPSSDQYWQDRERGMLNAYSALLGQPAFDTYQPPGVQPAGWTASALELAGFTATELDQGAVTLVFLRLGDFETQCLWEQTNGCSAANPNPPAPPYLAFTKATPALPSQTIGREGLIDVLADLFGHFDATFVGTLDSTNLYFDVLGESVATGPEVGYQEYWDHYYTALFALTAALRSGQPLALASYRGYTISREPEDLADADACAKQAVFDRYAVFDSDVGEPPRGAYDLASPLSWERRSYAARSLGGTAGRLATAGGCLAAAGDALVLAPCAAAPVWTLTTSNELALGDGRCAAIAGASGYIDTPAPVCGDAPCDPVPPVFPPEPASLVPCPATPAEATALAVFDDGQIRTANARCLAADASGVTSADCANTVAGAHVTGAPPAAQAWWLQ